MEFNDINIVYFSSVTEYTKKFVNKLPWTAERIPLRRNDPELVVDYDYILFTPTYGAGRDTGAVPKQVVSFLRPLHHRRHCRGIVGSGNKNFGEHYLLAARMLSEKLHVPVIYGFELSGTTRDVDEVQRRMAIWCQHNTTETENVTLCSG